MKVYEQRIVEKVHSFAGETKGQIYAKLTILITYRECIIIVSNDETYHMMKIIINEKCKFPTKND